MNAWTVAGLVINDLTGHVMKNEILTWRHELIEPYLELLGGSILLLELRKTALTNMTKETIEIPLPMIYGIKIKAICEFDYKEFVDKNRNQPP